MVMTLFCLKKYSMTAIAMAMLVSCGEDNYSRDKSRAPHFRVSENQHAALVSEPQSGRSWLAGDHHIHSRYSSDGKYSVALNAQMAHAHGLDWMVLTDHGGPGHSLINREQAYPDLVASRSAIPEVLQFYGMEFDTPAAQHSSLIIPYSLNEAEQLFQLERDFNREDEPGGSAERNTEGNMLTALVAMQAYDPSPLLIANHPSRSAYDLGHYPVVSPAEMRAWNNIAPNVVIGMEASPGHQAASLNADGSLKAFGSRGGYSSFPTMGGYDQMTAQLGGFWDSMLAEGRNWWITANSDSHIHYTEGGRDFWPGEYTKTYIYAEKNYTSIFEGLRAGKAFVVTGDLIDDLSFTLVNKNHRELPVHEAISPAATMGETLILQRGNTLKITIRVRDPDTKNARGNNPTLARVDVIRGSTFTETVDPEITINPSVEVVERFYMDQIPQRQGYVSLSLNVADIQASGYIRLRGTSIRDELEPQLDPSGEDPWQDLWFYSNPIFYEVTN